MEERARESGGRDVGYGAPHYQQQQHQRALTDGGSGVSVQVMDVGRWRRPRSVLPAWRAWRRLGSNGRSAIVVAAVAIAVTTLVWLTVTPAALATGAALAALVAAAIVDVAERRLPNRLVILAGVPVLAAAVVGPAAAAVIGAAAVAVPLVITHLVSPAGLGFGDVKAGTVLGGALGLLSPVLAPAALLVGLLGSAAWALAARRRSVPLGPGLVGGAIAASLIGFSVGVEPW
jgi:leader peptidase (prepilin peptidase)/N-methyltransferase